MGIRGAGTLLTDDRRRFGRPCLWNGTRGPKEIYVDGPALIYHLLSLSSDNSLFQDFLVDDGDASSMTRALSSSSSFLSCQSCACAHMGSTMCPPVLYHRARCFATRLRDACRPSIRRVYLVLDGLASECKVPCQMERMQSLAKSCGDAARRLSNEGGRSTGTVGVTKSVPHLFAERAIAEAFVDLAEVAKDNDGEGCRGEEGGDWGRGCMFQVCRATGEAEGCIASMLLARDSSSSSSDGEGGGGGGDDDDDDDIIILSNDTDFLVYPPCKCGFVPLHSLRFIFDPVVTVTGWQYTRSRFLSAYPALRSHPWCIAIIAGLAGCDYSLGGRHDEAIERARRKIVQSDLGGLRKRVRNAPTAKGTLVAVLRFVCHCFAQGAADGGRLASDPGRRQRQKRRGSQLGATYADDFRRGSEKEEREDEDSDVWIRQLAHAATECMESSGRESSKGRGSCEQDPRAAEKLIEALRAIVNVYREDMDQMGTEVLRPLSSSHDENVIVENPVEVDVRRLVEHRTLYCRPVVELGRRHNKEGAVRGGRARAKKKKKRKQRGQKMQLKRLGVSAHDHDDSKAAGDAGVEDQASIMNDHPTVPPLDPSASEGDGSWWTTPHLTELRRRLYTIVSLSDLQAGEGSSASFTVDERRFCVDLSLSMEEVNHDVQAYRTTGDPHLDEALRAPTTRTLVEALEYCLFLWQRPTMRIKAAAEATTNQFPPSPPLEDLSSFEGMLSTMPAEYRRVFLSALLLPEKDAAILFLMSSAPLSISLMGRWGDHEFQGKMTAQLIESMSRIQVSCFHADLLVGVSSHLFGAYARGSALFRQSWLRSSAVFRCDIGSAVQRAFRDRCWDRTSASRENDTCLILENEDHLCECAIKDILASLPRCVPPVAEACARNWINTASLLWKGWIMFRYKNKMDS